MTLNDLIENAIDHEACHEEIKKIIRYKTFEEATKDKNAPYWCYWYAIQVMKGRFEEGECVILLSPSYSYYYALDILKQRWEEGEPIILTNSLYTYLYARDVIKGRWEQAEPIIFSDDNYKQEYCHYFDINE